MEPVNKISAGQDQPLAVTPLAARRFGLLPVLLFAALVAVYACYEIRPEAFRPLISAIRPDETAVRTSVGPGVPRPPGIAHTPMPAVVKGLYLSASGAGDKRVMARTLGIVERTEINSLVIDVKEGGGQLAFLPKDESLKPFAAAKPSLGDLAAFVAPLKAKGIYLIARDFVFQDQFFAEDNPQWAVKRLGGGLWRDRRGTPWLDAGCKDVWDYNIALAVEAYEAGFDEIQFDYIRFPSDGNLTTVSYPCFPAGKEKWRQMGEFFVYLDHELRLDRHIPISVDLFGLTMDQHDDDLGIGQRLREGLPHFDAISPMTYPSHYAAGFEGFQNPAAHPYEVVRKSMIDGNKLRDTMTAEGVARLVDSPGSRPVRLATFRPWLQDFDMGAEYTPDFIRAQIRAVIEQDGSGWLLWNASNAYTEAALEPGRP